MSVRKGVAFLIIFLLIICVFSYALFVAGLSTQYFFTIKEELARYDTRLNERIILSIIKTESNFNKNARSNKGALGLMQIMPTTAKYIINGMAKENRRINGNLFNEKDNIAMGVWYLAYLERKFNSLDYVLIAYNAGETIAKRWEKEGIKPSEIPYKETRNYVKKVNFYYENYSIKSNIAKIVN